MSDIKIKSWLMAASGLLLSTVCATSAMAVANLEDALNTENATVNDPDNINTNSTFAPAGTTSLTGDLWAGTTSANAQRDEDAFNFYLEAGTAFNADVDFTAMLGAGTSGAEPVMTLFRKIGVFWTKEAGGDPTATPFDSLDSIAFTPTVSANYLLLVTAVGNDPINGGSGLIGNAAFGAGAVWTGMNGNFGTSGSYSIVTSGVAAAAAVPVPAAVWLFGSGLMGLVGVARRKKA